MKPDQNEKQNSLIEKRFDKYDVVIIGDFIFEAENFFSKLFSESLNNYKYKFINNVGLRMREEVKFPKDFINVYYPEILDKIINIDILFLTIDSSNKSSIELLTKFYYLYYNKLEKNDKPKNIIIIEFYSNSKDIPNKQSDSNLERLKSLFNGYFYNYEDNEEKLNKLLYKCILNIGYSRNVKENISYIKQNEFIKEINDTVSIYGEKKLQNAFLKILLESKCNFKNKKLDDNIYEIEYEKCINNEKFNFILTLKLIGNEYNNEHYSIYNILLYDINNLKTLDNIKKNIKQYLLKNESKQKRIFNLYSLNFTSKYISDNENINQIKKGKVLSNKIGGYFSVININNNKDLGDKMKIEFEKLLEKIFNNVNAINTENKEKERDNNSNHNQNYSFHYVFEKYNSPLLYIKEINNKMKSNYKDNINFLYNICPVCCSHLNIRINYTSNIIILYCNICNQESKGLSIDQFIKNNKKKNNFFHCKNCNNLLNYQSKKKKYFCTCELTRKTISLNESEKNPIPFFLNDTFCDVHNKFHKYYMKYSKKGLCEDCKKEKEDLFCIEKFNDDEIKKLINKKKLESKNELKFINSLQDIFNECINSLIMEFENLIEYKLKFNSFKTELINTLEVIKNNYTIISNINSLKFDEGEQFIKNQKDSIKNKIKYLFKYLKSELDINNLFFGRDNNSKRKNITGPYNNLINKEEAKITDICGINNNKFICASYNDGQVKIFDLSIDPKNIYPICVINEFIPNQGVNSIYISKNFNFWKENNSNKNEIIYLNGFEEIKIIQMNDNYDSYELLYTLKDEYSNIYNSIEIDNKILMLDNFNNIKLINLQKEDNKIIKYETKNITSSLIPQDKFPTSLYKISDNIISLNLSSNNNFRLSIVETTNFEIPLENNSVNKKRANRFYSVDEDENNYLRTETLVELKDFMEPELINKNDINDKYIKILYLNENNPAKNDINILNIKKEFMFDKNFILLGCLSEEDNLFLLNNTKENDNKIENIHYIFDLNICQFIHAFKFHCSFREPILFAKINCKDLLDKSVFILCDGYLNFIQIFFDKDYINKIYYISSETKQRSDINISKIINLDQKIICLCNNNEYYLLNNF